jgi:hypothetical protein
MRDNLKIIGNIHLYLGASKIIWLDYNDRSIVAMLNNSSDYYIYTYSLNDVDDNLPFEEEDSI